jgi:hypothetical protein
LTITEVDDEGKVLSAESYAHFCQHRVRCRECQSIFCTSCKRSPYHKGFTCKSFVEYQSARHCRFCDTKLDEHNTAAPYRLTDGSGDDAAAAAAAAGCAGAGGAADKAVQLRLKAAAAIATPSSSSSSSSSSASSAASAAVDPACFSKKAPFAHALADVCTGQECLDKRALSCDKCR